MTRLERQVLRLVREFGPISGNAIADRIPRRRSDVLSALEALRKSGVVRGEFGRFEVAGGPGTGDAKSRGPTRPRPGVSIYFADRDRAEAVEAALRAAGFDAEAEAVRRALDRKRRRTA